jgi:hypothetical protein
LIQAGCQLTSHFAISVNPSFIEEYGPSPIKFTSLWSLGKVSFALIALAIPQTGLTYRSHAEKPVTIDCSCTSICDNHQIVIKLKFIDSIILAMPV